MQDESLVSAAGPEGNPHDSAAAMPAVSVPPPIFILAAPVMPSQTVAAALGRNPLAQDLPELNLELMPTVDVLLRELTGLRTPQIHGLLRAIAHLLTGEQTGAAVETARRWLGRRAYLGTDAAAAELAALVAPRRIVAPVAAALFDRGSLKRLRASFPTAVFVHLHAHPRSYGQLVLAERTGQAALLLAGAVDEKVNPALPDPQELWLMVETAVQGFLQDLPDENQFALRLEDLVADPEATLTGLAARLGLASDAQAVARMLRPELSVFAGPGPIGAHLSGAIRSFAALTASLPAAMAVKADDATPDAPRLMGPLSWRPDRAGFRAEVQDRARALGYV